VKVGSVLAMSSTCTSIDGSLRAYYSSPIVIDNLGGSFDDLCEVLPNIQCTNGINGGI